MILKPILTELRQSYVNRDELKTQMYGPWLEAFTAYKEVYEIDKALAVLLELEKCLEGSMMCTVGTPILLDIAQCFVYLQNLDAAKKYALQAMKLLKIRIGADEELFKEIFPEVIDILQ